MQCTNALKNIRGKNEERSDGCYLIQFSETWEPRYRTTGFIMATFSLSPLRDSDVFDPRQEWQVSFFVDTVLRATRYEDEITNVYSSCPAVVRFHLIQLRPTPKEAVDDTRVLYTPPTSSGILSAVNEVRKLDGKPLTLFFSSFPTSDKTKSAQRSSHP